MSGSQSVCYCNPNVNDWSIGWKMVRLRWSKTSGGATSSTIKYFCDFVVTSTWIVKAGGIVLLYD